VYVAEPTLSAPSAQVRGRLLRGGVAAVPLIIAALGALAARPIADDYAMEGMLTYTGSIWSAFMQWMNAWTSFYSMWAILTVGTAAGRVLGVALYYPMLALSALTIFVVASRVIVRTWSRVSGVKLAVLPATLLLSSALLGGFVSLRRPATPASFGALYWWTIFVPHLLPVLLAPVALVVVVRFARLRARSRAWPLGLIAAFLAGFFLAGFAFVETAIVVVATVATAWTIRRLRGSDNARAAVAFLAAMAIGLIVGFLAVLLLPGTSARQSVLAGSGTGIATLHGLSAWPYAIASTARHTLAWTMLSPAPVLGAAVGWTVRRSSTLLAPTEQERHVVRTVGTALGGTAVASWILVTLGDIASYRAWWHLFPLWVQVTLLGALAGWRLAAVQRWTLRGEGGYLTWVVHGLLVLWCAAVTFYAASASWDRRAVVDANIAAARAVVSGAASGPVIWQSQSVGGIEDMQPDQSHWVNYSVAQWFGLHPSDFQVVVRHGRRSTLAPSP
jgi:hypothetical protein